MRSRARNGQSLTKYTESAFADEVNIAPTYSVTRFSDTVLFTIGPKAYKHGRGLPSALSRRFERMPLFPRRAPAAPFHGRARGMPPTGPIHRRPLLLCR